MATSNDSRFSGKLSSQDFSQQIRKLESEGAMLLAATNNLGDSLGITGLCSSQGAMYQGELQSLADISSEQKTLEEIRDRLDAHSRDTQSIGRSLIGPSMSDTHLRSSNILNMLDIPIGADRASLTHGTAAECIPRTQMESQLKQAKDEVASLRTHISEAVAISERQKEHFRSHIEEMRGTLHAAIMERDSVTEAKKRESAKQEAEIFKLQQTVEKLEATNLKQEQALVDVTQRLETNQRNQHQLDVAVNKLRGLLLEQEHRRGRPYSEGDTIHLLPTAQLMHPLSVCLTELAAECEHRNKRVNQLTSELDSFKMVQEEKERQIAQEAQERLLQLQEEHEKQLDVAKERSKNAKEHVASQQEEIQMLSKQSEQQLRMKEERIQDLEKRLAAMRDEHEEEQRSWRHKREGLERALDDTQRDLVTFKQDKEESVRQSAIFESRAMDAQQTALRLEAKLEVEKVEKAKFLERDQEIRQREIFLDQQLKEKDLTILDLRKSLDTTKLECNTRLQHTVVSLEKEGSAKVVEEVRSLNLQLSAMTEKCHRLHLDLELSKTHHGNLREKYDDVKASEAALKDQLQSLSQGKDHVDSALLSRSAETDQLRQERERHVASLESQAAELLALRTTRERLTIQLEEREKNFLALQQQCQRLSEAVGDTARSSGAWQQEKDSLTERIQKISAKSEEARLGRDSLVKKIRVKDAQIQELKEDNVKLAGEVRESRAEAEHLSKGKDSLFEELRQSRYDVSSLKKELTATNKRLEDRSRDMVKKAERMKYKLQNVEHDLQMTQKALKAREHTDGQAVKVAGKMQMAVTEKRSEIDSLRSQIHVLEDRVEAVNKERKLLKAENGRLEADVQGTRQQQSQLTSQLNNAINKIKQLKRKEAQLLQSIEKAAVKQAATQAELETHQQNMARLQLKHQLELKEVQRTGHLGRSAQLSRDPSTGERAEVGPPTALLSYKARDPVPPRSAWSTTDRLAQEEGHPAPQTSGSVPEDMDLELKGLLDAHRWDECLPEQDSMRASMELAQCVSPAAAFEKSVSADLLSKYMEIERSNVLRCAENCPRVPVPGAVSGESHLIRNRDVARSESPVARLLAGVQSHRPDARHMDGPVSSRDEVEEPETLPADKGALHQPMPLDAQRLCKRLEHKIASLTDLGCQLQKENKDISLLMRDQDSKLKKVKTQIVK